MRFFFTRKIVTAAFLLCALLFCVDSFAQLGPMFDTSRRSRKEKGDSPTTISADSMDLDIANDKAILLGNVDVRDPEMTIKCRKMIIYLGKTEKAPAAENAKPENKNNPSETGEKKSGASDPQSEQAGKEVIQIDCIGDVVITRAAAAGVKDLQQAFAGKAVYMLKDDTITLTEDPVVVNGPTRMVGETLVLNTKTERVIVVKGVINTKGAVLQSPQ
ncbi:MAG: OstA-like protein [Lentisphaerae bacterium ADurb.Bin242]|nr:MAG: OstA-like protein [Lentisphaerae bacterium ADurb.Bin242]